jgi:hypothetical protein
MRCELGHAAGHSGRTYKRYILMVEVGVTDRSRLFEPDRSQPRVWSSRFIELAGSAKDFPYPPEPPAAEPAPDLD